MSFCHLLPLMILPLAGAAQAARGDKAEEAARAAEARGPAASAAEMPALAKLLEKAGWEPTPELSGVFQAGSIFERTQMGHRALVTGCFAARPVESSYTAVEVVSSLQAGVSVGSPMASGDLRAGIVKKVKFGTPTQVTIPGLELQLSDSCAEKLKKLPSSRLQNAYVVQEVLMAEISEQTCGRIDARGRFLGLGEAEADYAAACAQVSLEPVAVGYRTVPLLDLMGGAPPPAAPTATRAAPPAAPAATRAPPPAAAPAASAGPLPPAREAVAVPRQKNRWELSIGAESYHTEIEGDSSWSTAYGPSLRLDLPERVGLRLRVSSARHSASDEDWLQYVVSDQSELNRISDWRSSVAHLATFWSPPLDSALGRLSIGLEGSFYTSSLGDSLDDVGVSLDYERYAKVGPGISLVRPTHLGGLIWTPSLALQSRFGLWAGLSEEAEQSYSDIFLPDPSHSRYALRPEVEATLGCSVQKGIVLLSLEGGVGKSGVSKLAERLAEEEGSAVSGSDWEPLIRLGLGLRSR